MTAAARRLQRAGRGARLATKLSTRATTTFRASLPEFAAALESIQGPSATRRVGRPVQNADVALWIMDRIAAVDGPVMIFFDDMEALHNPVVTALVGRGLESVPSNVRIIIGSRIRPDIGLARLRGKGVLVEVDVNALRFSEHEAQDFLTQRRGMALSPEAGGAACWVAPKAGPRRFWLASLAMERAPGPGDLPGGILGIERRHRRLSGRRRVGRTAREPARLRPALQRSRRN